MRLLRGALQEAEHFCLAGRTRRGKSASPTGAPRDNFVVPIPVVRAVHAEGAESRASLSGTAHSGSRTISNSPKRRAVGKTAKGTVPVVPIMPIRPSGRFQAAGARQSDRRPAVAMLI